MKQHFTHHDILSLCVNACKYLLAWFIRVVDFLRLDVLHDTNCSHHKLNSSRWVLHGFHNCNISGLKREYMHNISIILTQKTSYLFI